MRQFISFYAIRETLENRSGRLQPRSFVQAARAALVNISGISYPNYQGASMWTDFQEDGKTLVFTFDRNPPFGQLRIESDCSFTSTRSPLEEESERNLFLEALTWEFVFNMEFFSRFIAKVGRSGGFRIGIQLGGFRDAQIDWSGFEENKNEGTLINWRFRPKVDIASFEAYNSVEFPCKGDKKIDDSIAEAIGELSFKIIGIRHRPLDKNVESPLYLKTESIEKVIKDARKRMSQNGRKF
jgi:hypothetical protein